MTDIQGAVGIVQLGKLDDFLQERERQAHYYSEKLAGLDWLSMPHKPDKNGRHAWQAFVTYVDPEKHQHLEMKSWKHCKSKVYPRALEHMRFTC